MLEEHVFDLLPGYALGCLDEEDLITVARHLAGCADCRSELSTYWTVAGQLAQAASPRNPPAGLRERILRRAEASNPGIESRMAGRPASQNSSSPARPARGMVRGFRLLWTRPVGAALGLVALLLIIFMAASSFLLWQRVNDLEARVSQDNMQLVRLEGTANAPQARGYLLVFKNEMYGTLVVENAPRLKPGTQYQLWLIRDGKRTSGGVFSVSEDGYGTLQVSASQPLETYPAFGITIEPFGGSPAPTGEKVFGGNL